MKEDKRRKNRKNLRKAILEYIEISLLEQFRELNSNANEIYWAWGNDGMAKENKEKQEEILMLINKLKNK